MSAFMGRTAKHYFTIRAARQIVQEIEKAGLDNLKILAENGISIVGTYLKGCEPQEKALRKRDLNAVLTMGISLDVLLEEVIRQMPEISPLMQGREGYRKTEIQELEQFLTTD